MKKLKKEDFNIQVDIWIECPECEEHIIFEEDINTYQTAICPGCKTVFKLAGKREKELF